MFFSSQFKKIKNVEFFPEVARGTTVTCKGTFTCNRGKNSTFFIFFTYSTVFTAITENY
jgi:hypothetical protein